MGNVEPNFFEQQWEIAKEYAKYKWNEGDEIIKMAAMVEENEKPHAKKWAEKWLKDVGRK